MRKAPYACHGFQLASDLVAVGSDGNKSFADLQADVARVMPHVARSKYVVIACEDRYRFTVALLAAWQAGARVVLAATVDAANAATANAADGAATAYFHDRVGMGTDLRTVLATPSVGYAELRALAADQCLVTLTTSGTTGEPLSVAKSARQLLGEAQDRCSLLAPPRPHAVLSVVPPRHIYGLLFGVLAPLQLGVPFVRETPHMPEAIVDCAQRHDADVLVSVPAHLVAIAASRLSALGPLKRVFSSGAPLPRACFSALLSRYSLATTEVLGSTETGGIARRSAADEPFEPFAGVRITVNEVGDLSLTSPYVEGPELVATGDRVELTADGRFHHLGRVDGVVKVGGTRVSLAAIEDRVRSLPGVRDVAVLSVESGTSRGAELWLAAAADGWDAARIRAALREWFEPVLLPRRFRIVERLPRDAAGKLPKAALRALFDDRNDIEPSAPPNKCEVIDVHRSTDNESERVTVNLRVPPDLVYFQGHFPGDPILPGVVQLQVVAIGQARAAWPTLGATREVRRLKFTHPIRPDDIIQLTLNRTVGSEDRVVFSLSVAGTACASGTILFAWDTVVA